MNISIFSGAPQECGNRQQREQRVYSLLETLNIPYTRADHEPAGDMQACKAVSEALGVDICKNLFLCNRQQTVFYLLLMPADKPFKTKELSAQINSSRLSFAGAEYMEKYLDILPGSVSVLGLMNDSEHHVKLLIDSDLLKDEYIGCHPCVNTSTLAIKTSDITEMFLKHTGHIYDSVKLVGLE